MTHLVDVPWLIEQYQAGRSAKALASDLGVDVSAVRTRLVRAGVSIRGAREATAANMARDPNLRTRMGAPRTYPVNPEYFTTRTPAMAYIVGLFMADGSNTLDDGEIRITLKASDGPLLTDIAEEMGAARPLRPDKYGNPCLCISNRGLSEGLARWGVVSPKTHTASTHPELLSDRDYWRGVIDGDGSLCGLDDGRKLIALVGSSSICEQFLAFCQARGAGLRSAVNRHKGIWSVHISGRRYGQDAVAVADVLYRDAPLALSRKRLIADRWRLGSDGSAGANVLESVDN